MTTQIDEPNAIRFLRRIRSYVGRGDFTTALKTLKEYGQQYAAYGLVKVESTKAHPVPAAHEGLREAKEALGLLLQCKRVKDTLGKTNWYLHYQPIAWEKAKKAIATLDAIITVQTLNTSADHVQKPENIEHVTPDAMRAGETLMGDARSSGQTTVAPATAYEQVREALEFVQKVSKSEGDGQIEDVATQALAALPSLMPVERGDVLGRPEFERTLLKVHPGTPLGMTNGLYDENCVEGAWRGWNLRKPVLESGTQPLPEIGDYVLATKFSDGDPGDAWGVGYYDGVKYGDRHMVKDGCGAQIRIGGFRRVARITAEYGKWLLTNAAMLEKSPPGMINLWGMLNPTDVEDGAS